MIRALLVIVAAICFQFAFAYHVPWVKIEYPQDWDKLWWDDAWWEEGRLDSPSSYDVAMEVIAYESGDAEIPAYLFRPVKPGKYLPILFQHGRRGLDDLTLLAPKRLAARGFVVLAPDVWNGRFFLFQR